MLYLARTMYRVMLKIHRKDKSDLLTNSKLFQFLYICNSTLHNFTSAMSVSYRRIGKLHVYKVGRVVDYGIHVLLP